MLISTVAGNLGQDAEIRYTGKGNPQFVFSVAVEQSKKNDEGTWEKYTDWVRVNFFPREGQVEYVTARAIKGARVVVVGKQTMNAYISKKDNLPHASAELFAPYEVQWLSAPGQPATRGDDGEDAEPVAAATKSNGTAKRSVKPISVDDDSDLPF